MRPGIVHSSPAAQGIVRFYCSSGRGVCPGGVDVLVCPAGAVLRAAVRELGGGCTDVEA